MAKQPGLLQGASFQAWRTPQKVFDFWSRTVGGFDLDAAADDENHLCPRYLTEKDNALALDVPWRATAVWCNPPYDDCGAWVDKALFEVASPNGPNVVVLLLRCDTSTRWFKKAFDNGHIVFIRGRIMFELPPGMPNPKRSSVANVVVVFEKSHSRSVSVLDLEEMLR